MKGGTGGNAVCIVLTGIRCDEVRSKSYCRLSKHFRRFRWRRGRVSSRNHNTTTFAVHHYRAKQESRAMKVTRKDSLIMFIIREAILS